MKPLFMRMAGFAAFPLLSAIVPLLLMPIVARIAGPSGWATISSGLAIGIFASAVILYGWNIVGPVRIAQSSDQTHRRQLYLDSIATRLILLILVLPAAALLILFVTSGTERPSAVLLGIAVASGGLSPSWYCIGIGRPRLLAFVDTVPRVAGALISIPLLLLTHQIWVYAVLMLSATAASLLLFHVSVMREATPYRLSLRRIVLELKQQTAAAGVNLAGNAYGSTPVPIAERFSAGTLASRFASIDQLYRYALFPVVVLANAFQSWTLEVDGHDGKKRQLIAIGAHTILGILGGAALAVLGPWLSGLFFGSSVAASQQASLYYGFAFMFLSIAAPLQRNILVPNNQAGLVMAATIAAAVIGLAIMIAAASQRYLDGVALGMAVSEAVVLLLLATPAVKVLSAGGVVRMATWSAPK